MTTEKFDPTPSAGDTWRVAMMMVMRRVGNSEINLMHMNKQRNKIY